MRPRCRVAQTRFDCIHMPSINLPSFPAEQQTRLREQGSPGLDEQMTVISRRVTRRPLKLSFTPQSAARFRSRFKRQNLMAGKTRLWYSEANANASHVGCQRAG